MSLVRISILIACLFSFLLFPIQSPALAEEASIEAKRVAYGFLKRQSDMGSKICGEWENKFISIGEPVTFYGKNREIDGYEFPVFANGSPAGYIYVYSQDNSKSPIPFFSTTEKALSHRIYEDLEVLVGRPIDESKIVFFRFGLAKIIALVEKETNAELYQHDLPLTNDGQYFIFGYRNAVGITSERFNNLVDQYNSASKDTSAASTRQVPSRNREREFYYNNSEAIQNGLEFGVKDKDGKQ